MSTKSISPAPKRPTSRAGRLLSRTYRLLGEGEFGGQTLLDVLKIRKELRKTLRIPE